MTTATKYPRSVIVNGRLCMARNDRELDAIYDSTNPGDEITERAATADEREWLYTESLARLQYSEAE